MWRESAGCAKHVVGKSRTYLGKTFEGFPCRLFTDGDVRVVGPEFLAGGGIGYADGEAHGDEHEECSDFLFAERKFFVETGDHCGGDGEDVWFTEDGVRAGDGDFGDGEAVVHVAEVDDAQGLAGERPRRADQDVVVVGVAVNHAAAELSELRDNFGVVQSGKFFYDPAAGWVGNFVEVIFDPACGGGVPFEFAGGGGVLKSFQCRSYFAQEDAKAFQEFFAVGADFGELDGVDVGEEPDEAFGFVGCGDFGEGVLVFGGDDPGELKVRGLLREMLEGLALQIDEAAVAGWVHYFQDELRAVAGD